MKNTAEDLRNILMAQMEAISNPEEGTDMKEELAKAKALSSLASQVIGLEREETQRMKLTGGASGSKFFPTQKQIGQ